MTGEHSLNTALNYVSNNTGIVATVLGGLVVGAVAMVVRDRRYVAPADEEPQRRPTADAGR